MLLVLHCECGATYRAEEQHVGGSIRCRTCSRIITVGKPNPPAHILPTSRLTCSSGVIDPKRPVSALSANRKKLVWLVAILAGILGIVALTYVRSKPTGSVPSLTTPSPSVPVSLISSGSSKSEAVLPPKSLANGTNIIRPRGPRGHGTLKITNGTSYDAVVRLADSGSKRTRRLIYVSANSEFQITGIGSGSCILQFAMGTDWNVASRKFQRDQSYSQFDDSLEFKEIRTDFGVEWAEFEVTLHPVLYGSARTSAINESDFVDKEPDESP